MKAYRFKYQIIVMCRVLDVSESGYYKWLKQTPSPRQIERTANEVAIKAAHVSSRQTYGYDGYMPNWLSKGTA